MFTIDLPNGEYQVSVHGADHTIVDPDGAIIFRGHESVAIKCIGRIYAKQLEGRKIDN